MSGYALELRGCTPEPLGNYLKGLGVFRLIAEQADPQARAWWKDGYLHLHTKWSKDKIGHFFLRGIGEKNDPIYCPTPIFAPWGGRPGFYKDGNKDAKGTLVRILCASLRNTRFAAAANTIRIIRAALRRHGWHKTKPKKEKAELAAICRNSWRESAVDWFDACISLEDEAKFGFLFGTGGNEGSADITNIFWSVIEESMGILPNPAVDTTEQFGASLWNDCRVGGSKESAGQHFPSATGKCPNMGQDFRGSCSTNPWDVLLMMEGAILFAGATTKRLSSHGKGKAAFPFMIDHLTSDEASASSKDEAKQDSQIIRCRAEFWMPLWTRPTSLPETCALLAEGKLQRVSGARTEHTLHALEAIKTLGVARGVDSFHRVALFERRGKGYYLASSLGYHTTARECDPLAPRLTEIDEFCQRVYSKLREGPGIPERVMRARRSLHSALATLLQRDERASTSADDALVEVLTGVAGVEREVSLLKDREQLLSPCPPLSQNWGTVDATAPEIRLAVALAGIAPWGESSEPNGPAVGAIRSNLLPLRQLGRAWRWDETSRSAVWSPGASLTSNLNAVLHRRLVDARCGNGEGLPLWSPHGITYADVLAYWNGTINETRTAELIHAFSLIGYGRWDQADIDTWQQRRPERRETPDIDTSQIYSVGDDPHGKLSVPRWLVAEFDSACELPRVYHLLKLCFAGGRLPRRPAERGSARRMGDEPFPPNCLDVLTLLEAGRLADAVRLATRRLRAQGYPTILREGDLAALPANLDCRRLAGMMLIPVRHLGVSAALAIKPESTM